jgi:8-oxo-dGTP diphosphatase
MTDEDKIRKVVSAVTFSPSKDRFLLVKRSSLRKRFPNEWEFPSGFLEDETEQQGALRELKEETGLIGEIIKTGDSFRVGSDSYDFRVYPVLVKVDSVNVQLTKEHEDFEWIEKDQIEDYNTVPQIKENLKSVDLL